MLLAQLERLSHEDPLTGLANRRRWDAELARRLHRRPGSGNSVVGVVLLDIDHFKTINDRHGHAGGDEALRAGGRAARRAGSGRGDLVARLGGDELAVLMPGADLDRAVRARRAAPRARRRRCCRAGFDPGELSLSLGVAAAAGGPGLPAGAHVAGRRAALPRQDHPERRRGAPPRGRPDPAAPLAALAEHLEGLRHPALPRLGGLRPLDRQDVPLPVAVRTAARTPPAPRRPPARAAARSSGTATSRGWSSSSTLDVDLVTGRHPGGGPVLPRSAAAGTRRPARPPCCGRCARRWSRGRPASSRSRAPRRPPPAPGSPVAVVPAEFDGRPEPHGAAVCRADPVAG